MNMTLKIIAVVSVLLIISISTVFETESDYMNMIRNVRAIKTDCLEKPKTMNDIEKEAHYMKLIQEVRANKSTPDKVS